MRLKRSTALVTAPQQLPEEVFRTANQSGEFILHELAKFGLTQVKQRVALVATRIKKGGRYRSLPRRWLSITHAGPFQTDPGQETESGEIHA